MRRRDVIAGLLSGTTLTRSPVCAQGKRIIGVLLPRDADAFWTVFLAALQQRGCVQGRDISFEIRTAGETSAAELAAELVRMKVSVIVAFQTPQGRAAKSATSEIPIVVAVGDPVGTGLVASLSHPGGNVTGV